MKNAQMLKILVLGFILGATTGTAVAFVDIRNGNFSESFSDLKIRVSQGESIRLLRTYNSRVRRSGLFGIGWCSNLETTLLRENEQVVSITECGSGRGTSYRPGRANMFVSTRDSSDVVVVEKNRFLRSLNGRKKQAFDRTGRLTTIFVDGKTEVKLLYDGTLKGLKTPSQSLDFRINGSGQVEQILEKKTVLRTYHYETNRLIETGPNREAIFSYDAKDRLTQIRLASDGNAKRIFYDSRSGLADRVIEANGCANKASYGFGTGLGLYSVEVTRSCPGGAPVTATYEIRRKQSSKGKWEFTQIKMKSGPLVSERIFEPRFQKLSKLVENGSQTEFIYNDQGQVRLIRGPSLNLWIRRNAQGLPTQISRDLFEKLSLSYDDQGRLATITDQNARRLNLKYSPSKSPTLLSEEPGTTAASLFDLYQNWLDMILAVQKADETT